MKKFYTVLFSILGIVLVGGLANASLWDYYNGDVPPLNERGAEDCGITNYIGTAEQNSKLEQCFGAKEITLGAPVSVYQRTILPEQTNTYDLGSPSNTWKNLYVSSTYANALYLNQSSLNVSTTFYVDLATGSDSNNGASLATAFRTIGKAMSSTCSSVIGGNFDIFVSSGEVLESVEFCNFMGNRSNVLGQGVSTANIAPRSFIRLIGASTTSTVITGNGVNNLVTVAGPITVSLQNLTVSSSYTATAIIMSDYSQVFLTDVNAYSTSTVLSTNDYSRLTINPNITITTSSFNHVGNSTGNSLSMNGNSQVDVNNRSEFMNTGSGNAIPISIQTNSRLMFNGANINTDVGATTPGASARGFSILTNSSVSWGRSGTSRLKLVNIDGPDSSNANSGAAIQVRGQSSFFASQGIVYSNVRVPLDISELSYYFENSAITQELINGSSSTLRMSPDSVAVFASTSIRTLTPTAFGDRGTSTSTVLGYTLWPNTFTATNTFPTVGVGTTTPTATLSIQANTINGVAVNAFDSAGNLIMSAASSSGFFIDRDTYAQFNFSGLGSVVDIGSQGGKAGVLRINNSGLISFVGDNGDVNGQIDSSAYITTNGVITSTYAHYIKMGSSPFALDGAFTVSQGGNISTSGTLRIHQTSTFKAAMVFSYTSSSFATFDLQGNQYYLSVSSSVDFSTTTLPIAGSVPPGTTYKIKDRNPNDTSVVRIVTRFQDTIDLTPSSTPYDLPQGGAVELVSDGVRNWEIN